jgi:hypothetical protein
MMTPAEFQQSERRRLQNVWQTLHEELQDSGSKLNTSAFQRLAGTWAHCYEITEDGITSGTVSAADLIEALNECAADMWAIVDQDDDAGDVTPGDFAEAMGRSLALLAAIAAEYGQDLFGLGVRYMTRVTGDPLPLPLEARDDYDRTVDEVPGPDDAAG